MSGGGNFFVEDAFGKIYERTFFAEDMKNFTSNSYRSAANAKEAAVNSATSQVRMSTEVEVLRESNKAFLSAYGLSGDLGSSGSTKFVGQIIGDF